MALYDRFQRTAQQLLAKFSQGSIELVKVTLGGGDPWNPTASTTAYTVDGAVRGVAAMYVDMEAEGGSVVQSSDLQIDIPAGGQVPTLDDHFNIDGTRYEILQVLPTPAAGTVAYYRCILRR